MARNDLLVLSLDDLAALTNRGTVKRAQREIEANECRVELMESAEGEVTAKWSDGVECRIPAGAVVGDGRCSCAAVGLCRHLVRTVLAYQRQAHEPDDGQGGPRRRKRGIRAPSRMKNWPGTTDRPRSRRFRAV